MSDTDASLEAQARVDAAAIEHHLRLHYGAAIASLKTAQVDPAGCRCTLHLLNPTTQESKAHHFRLTADGLAGAIREAKASAESGFNVYAKLVANRFGLAKRQPGTRNDWRVVLGFAVDLDGYKDGRGSLESLPLHPSLVIQTSAVPEPSAQAFYFLSAGIEQADAKLADAVAWGLAQIINDRDGGTANIIQSWRVAGTLNYPTTRKIAAGRPPHPQRVQLLPGGTETLYTPEALVDAIETELALDKPLVDAYRAAQSVSAAGGARTGQQIDDNKQQATKERWNGDARHLRRALDALASISSNIEYAAWKKIIGAWGWHFGETAFGKEVARLWCVGGTYEGIDFKGAPDRFDEEDFNRLWDAAVRGKLGCAIGTLYWFAHTVGGWDKSLARWGLGYDKPAPKAVELPPTAQAVLAAADAFPKDRAQLALAAWYYRVTLATKEADLLKIASDIREKLNWKRGYAIIEPHEIMGIRRWEPTQREIAKRDTSSRVRNGTNHLERLGVIVRNPGATIGAHGKRGQSIAVSPPRGESWVTLIQDYEVAYRSGKAPAEGAPDPTQTAMPTATEAPLLMGHNGGPAILDYNLAAPFSGHGWEASTPENKRGAPFSSHGSSNPIELQSGGGLPDGGAEVSQLEVETSTQVLDRFPLLSLLPPELLSVLERSRGQLVHVTSLHNVLIDATQKGVSPADLGVIVHEVFEAYIRWLKAKNKQLESEPPSKVFERIHDDTIVKLKESGLFHSSLYAHIFNKREKMFERAKKKAAAPPSRADGKPDLKIVSSNDDDVA